LRGGAAARPETPAGGSRRATAQHDAIREAQDRARGWNAGMTSGVCIQEDDDMLGRLIRGAPGAFNLLFEQHFEPLTRFVARMVDSQHVAAELVQDVFLRVWS